MRANLKSQIADLVNAAEGQGGANTAALYLSEFIVPPKTTTATATSSSDHSKSAGADSTGTLSDGTPTSSSPSAKSEPHTTGEDGLSDQGQDSTVQDNNDNNDSGRGPKLTWIHVDFPGAPLGLRAVYQFIKTMKR